MTRNTSKNKYNSEMMIKESLEKAKKEMEERKKKKREEIIQRMEKNKGHGLNFRKSTKRNRTISQKFLGNLLIPL